MINKSTQNLEIILSPEEVNKHNNNRSNISYENIRENPTLQNLIDEDLSISFTDLYHYFKKQDEFVQRNAIGPILSNLLEELYENNKLLNLSLADNVQIQDPNRYHAIFFWKNEEESTEHFIHKISTKEKEAKNDG